MGFYDAVWLLLASINCLWFSKFSLEKFSLQALMMKADGSYLKVLILNAKQVLMLNSICM
jgi:hypothetical protein